MHAGDRFQRALDTAREVASLLDLGVWTDERLAEINALTDIMIATRHTNEAVRAGDKLCGTRVIPLVVEKRQVNPHGSPTFVYALKEL